MPAQGGHDVYWGATASPSAEMCESRSLMGRVEEADRPPVIASDQRERGNPVPLSGSPRPFGPRDDVDILKAHLLRYRQAFGRDVWLAATHRYRGDDAKRLKRLAGLAVEAGVPLIATNDILYHEPERRQLQDVLTCVRH